MAERTLPRRISRLSAHSGDRGAQNVDLAVIHCMGERIGPVDGQVYSARAWLERLKTPAHVLIEPDGLIVDLVPPDRRASHAGLSRYGDRFGLNGTSVGVEFLVAGTHVLATLLRATGIDPDTYERLEPLPPDPYTDAQYNAGGYVVATWVREYPAIKRNRIVAHSTVSGPDVRPDPKYDPGPVFDWRKFWGAVDDWSRLLREQTVHS